MTLPRANSKLLEIYRNSSAPGIYELEGEYIVDMLTCPPGYRVFAHRKVFYRSDDKIIGHNILFNHIWGRFNVESGICAKTDSRASAIINYNRQENSILTRGIRDYLRTVEKDLLYLGRFNFMLSGRLIFLGYFSLERIS